MPGTTLRTGPDIDLLLGFTPCYGGLFMLFKSSDTETELSVSEMATEPCASWKFSLWLPWVFTQAEEWERQQVFTAAFSPDFNPFLTTSICYASFLCINSNNIKAHVSCVLLVSGHEVEHFEELHPKIMELKTTQLRLKKIDYQLHSSGFEEFLLCNYFSHRCQCHNKYMKSNKTQHKDANSFIYHWRWRCVPSQF